jgi:hypothetical protein
MFNMPFCAYFVQISTTFLESATEAFLGALEIDVPLDELHRAVGAGGDRLRAGAGEPVDHRAAGDQAQQERRVHQGELVDVLVLRPMVRATMIEKIMVVAPTTAVPMSTGLEVALKVLPAPSFSSRFSLAISKSGVKPKVLLNVLGDVGKGFDGGKLVDGLRVVGDRAVAIHGDGDRSHAQEAEGHQAEGEYRRGQHQGHQEHGAHEVADAHEEQHREAQPVGAEVAGHEAGEDVERRAAFPRAGDDFANVARIGGGEDLDELGDHRAGQRAATDDRGQLPPHGIVAAEAGDHEHADDVGEGDGKNRGEPDQGGEGRFEVHLDGVAEARLAMAPLRK